MKENNRNGFKIPDNYFEEFKQKIPELIKAEKSNKKPNRIGVYYAVAASIILLILSSLTFLPLNETENHNNPNYLLSDSEYYDLDMNDIYFAYNEEQEILEEINIPDDEYLNYIADEMELDELIILTSDK